MSLADCFTWSATWLAGAEPLVALPVVAVPVVGVSSFWRFVDCELRVVKSVLLPILDNRVVLRSSAGGDPFPRASSEDASTQRSFAIAETSSSIVSAEVACQGEGRKQDRKRSGLVERQFSGGL